MHPTIFAVGLFFVQEPLAPSCSQLDDVYIQAEDAQLAGTANEQIASQLLALARECDATAPRKALETYVLGFRILTEAQADVACSDIQVAHDIARKLSLEQPQNGRLAKLAIKTGQDSERCIETEAHEQPIPQKELVLSYFSFSVALRNPPDTPSRSEPLRRSAVAVGSVAGVTLVSSVVLTALGAREVNRVEAQLLADDPDGLADNPDVCRIGQTPPVATGYCGGVQRYQVAMAVSWSLFGATAVATIVLSSLYRSQRTSRMRIGAAPMSSGFQLSSTYRF